ncbi:hypothetical protein ACG33_03330 [Steroidobacter denitrificans]|uniref:Amidinotransferase n=2 Tax=Steroidobacter denitrificans TaxID=465721 RepID=A0A127F6T5_STEDE|nr:hypothetical protein ACG33_03330 [Steroidobacter denitrificans]
MIRPVRYAANPQTAASNRFQVPLSHDQGDPRRDGPIHSGEAATTRLLEVESQQKRVQAAACFEFDALAAALRLAGVRVHVFDDTAQPHTPDSIFPNNWVSFHADGTVVLYPMLAENRRLERRQDVLESLSAQQGFRVERIVDLTHHERQGRFLEGTGSLVLDRVHRIAYACLSARTNLDVLGDFAQQLDYEIVAFEARDAHGMPVYHTNVMMSVGSRVAAICAASIREDERAAVLDTLRATGHEILDLSIEQLTEFPGNMLALSTSRGESIVAMSQRALGSLSAEQRAMLETHGGSIVACAVPTIEALGGGSVRCMLAEIHLPRKN